MRLIDADALIEKAWDADTRAGYVQVVDLGDIEDAPTIEARPVVRGEWLPSMFYTAVVGVKCSECNTTRGAKSNFCPSCGAEMRGTEDDARSESR